MPHRSGPKLSDDELEQLARRWFLEVRTSHPEKLGSELQRNATGEIGSGVLDWLFDSGDGDTAGDDGSN